jgi:hypothetical protein
MSNALASQQGLIPRRVCIVLCIIWPCWIDCGPAFAAEFTLKGNFVVDSTSISDADMFGTCQHWADWQVVDQTVVAGPMGLNRWGAQIGPIHAVAGSAYIGGQTHAIFQWQNNLFSYDCMAEAESRGATWDWGDHLASIQSSSMVSGSVKATIESSSEPDGYPIYLMTQHVPGGHSVHATSGGTTNWNDMDSYYYQRSGPAWSGIQEGFLSPERNHIFQVGDSDALSVFAWAFASTSSLGDTSDSASIAFSGDLEFRVRRPDPGEKSERPLGSGKHFRGDDSHPCFYAAMAMILDFWADKFPELRKNSAAEYYAALDKCKDPKLQYLDNGVAMLNNYFGAKNGCRTGGAVPLRAVGPRFLSDLEIERVRSPLIVTGRQALADNSFKLPENENIAHAMVVDGYHRVRGDYGDWETWLAVRDTWDDGLTQAVSVSTSGAARFRSYWKDNLEWWPLDYESEDSLWFPQMGYGFRPTHYIEIEPTFPFGGLPSEINIQNLSGDDFDRVIGAQTVPVLTPFQLWQVHSLGSNVRVAPMDARVLTSLVVGPPAEEAESGYRLRVQLQQPVTVEVSLTCYSTRKVTIAFDYACKAGTLQLFAGSTLLATIPRTASNELSAFQNTFTLASEGTTTFALRLTGAAGDELYLDNLALTNPVAEQIRINLNDSGRVNFSDFTPLSTNWLKSGCVAPQYCQGADIDHSGKVDFADLLLFIDQWMWKDPDLEDTPGDFNGDGRVNLLDYALLARDWQSTDVFLETDLNEDGAVDLLDFLQFSEYWLSPESW